MDMHTAYAEPSADAAAGRAGLAVGSEEARELLSYSPLVKRIVRQLNAQVCAAMGRDDMLQIGLIGLLDALRRYGAPDDHFGPYAAVRIRGAILDELRRQDWRPRGVRQESHRLRDALRELTRRLGREPSEAEILAGLGLSPQQWQTHQQDENAEELVSFDELVVELSNLPSGQRSPEEQFIARRSLEEALHKLDEREQRVIQLYYEFDLSLKEIAAVLEVTEARVCQINKGALRKMKSALQAS